MIRSISILALLALVAVLATGCGSGSDSSQTTSLAKSDAPLSKAEFIKAGDEICEKGQAKQFNTARKYRVVHDEELSKLSPIAAEEKLIRLIVLPSVLGQARGLNSLSAPKGDEKKIKAIVTELETAVKEGGKDPMTIEGDYSETPFHDVDLQMREYGFEMCSQTP